MIISWTPPDDGNDDNVSTAPRSLPLSLASFSSWTVAAAAAAAVSTWRPWHCRRLLD
jgi:hypothetical protein